MKTVALTRVELAAAVIVAAQLVAAVAVWRFGSTGPIPMHFSGGGVVDRWGDRLEAARFLAGLAAVHAALQIALGVSARRRADQARGLAAGQMVVIAAMLGIGLFMTSLAAGDGGAAAPKIKPVLLCAIFAAVGAWLGKVSPNALVGVRTPWSLSSRLAWDKSNRLAGRLFFLTGLAGTMLTPLLPTPLALRAITAGVLLIAAVGVFESWRVWRADPDRLSA